MNKTVVSIIVQLGIRTCLQIMSGILIGLYICSRNPLMAVESKDLIQAIVPILAPVGSLLVAGWSLMTQLGLWKSDPPVAQ